MLDLTIIIPTHNRKKLVLRNLNYLSNYNINVIISESGNTDNYINYPKNNFLLLNCINLSMHQKIYKALKLVKSKYVAICADDDFIAIENLKFFIKFLEKNKEYSVVDGTYVYFKNYFGFFKVNQAYKNKYNFNNFSNDPNSRIKYSINNYTNFMYSIMRKEHLKLCLEFVHEVIDDKNFPEITEISLNLVSSILGKQRSLPKFWMAKDLNRYSKYLNTSNKNLPKNNDAIVIANWKEFFNSTLGIKYKNLLLSKFFLDASKFDLDHLSIIASNKRGIRKIAFLFLKYLNLKFNNIFLLMYKKIRISYILFSKRDYKKKGYPWNSKIEKKQLKLIISSINDQ